MLSPTTPARRTQQVVVSVQEKLLRLAQEAQYRIAQVGVVGQVGLAACCAALVVVASVLLPANQALHALSADLAKAQATTHAGAAAHGSVPEFLDKLPTRAQMPGVVTQIYQQAKAAGVSLDSGRYAYSAAKTGDIARYEVEFPVKGGYPAIRGFIDRTLNTIPAAGLDRLHIERKSVGDGVVSADVRFVIFVRGR